MKVVKIASFIVFGNLVYFGLKVLMPNDQGDSEEYFEAYTHRGCEVDNSEDPLYV
jgi:hypothetical protein